MAERGNRVLVQVCLECGKEYFFDDGASPADLKCEKCGNGVFRSFYADSQQGEAASDFSETTERDTATNDPATDIMPGDLHDLNNV